MSIPVICDAMSLVDWDQPPWNQWTENSKPEDLQATEPHPESNSVGLSLVNVLKWPNGSVLRIGFMDSATAAEKTFIENAARLWLTNTNANIEFDFNANPAAGLDILIKIDTTQEPSSAIGKLSLGLISKGGPSMRLRLDSGNPMIDTGRVLHEFGHALGAIHEHQTAAAKLEIEWYREIVYEQLCYSGPEWPEEKVDHNYFRCAQASQTSGSNTVDKDSVMIYEIKEEWTLNGFHCTRNWQLSDGDKLWIGALYSH